jgi:hypothetical protein
MALNFIKASGNIITEDFCISLSNETKAEYVKDKSFGESVKKIDELIATTFEKLRERWEENRTSILNNALDNSTLRQKWVIPFFKELGFDPIFVASNIKSSSGLEYQIPYKAWDSEFAPFIHMVNSTQELDDKDRSSRTHANKSPQDCLQQFLNTSDHQWAILANGKKIRIVRDFYHSITKGFLEFDLEGIFETANSEQFRVLYRVLHRSRFDNQYQGTIEQEFDNEGNLLEKPDNCLLELFHKKAKETGIKIGNKLRDQVINSIELLGNGFAEHLNPDDFQNGKVKAYYAEILNIIYRLLFLMFAEQKGWLPVRNSIYARTYSVNSLKERVARGNYSHDEENDLWEGLKITFTLVTKGYSFKNGDKINAFGGQLFSDKKISTILNLKIKNKYLLDAIYQLSFFKSENLINKINYANLAIDELGSVYESLLDYEPKLAKEATTVGTRQINRGTFFLDDRGSDRKTSGSYYTDSRLVAQLIDSALVPVIENAINNKGNQVEKETALLELKVADIACGSGAFLCAALEKMGEYLAIIRMGDEDRPTDEQLREAKRDVLLHCIYGVDLNPMALELAKFSLWITASLPDMPLSFLDHKLKFGNSLIGATPDLVKKGIPVEAYKEVGNDNKDTAKWLREKVKKELTSLAKGDSFQSTLDLRVTVLDSEEDVQAYLELLRNEQETPEEVEAAENEYYAIKKHLQHSVDWRLADAWTASFFIEKTDLHKPYPTNETLYNLRNGLPVNESLLNEIEQISSQYHFFHYHLEFPEVFENGGFDCLLGNPPWEKLQVEDKKFFKGKYEDIVEADATLREKLIAELRLTNPSLYNEYISEQTLLLRIVHYLKNSNGYEYSAKRNVNTYLVFSEKYIHLINRSGYAAIITPSGIATDDTSKDYFKFIIDNRYIISLYDFENSERIFDIHRSFKFCLLTLSKKAEIDKIDLLFFATNINHLFDESRHYTLTPEQFELINPNTFNCPVFRNKNEANVVLKLYNKSNVIHNENTGWNEYGWNAWQMVNDTHEKNLLQIYQSENSNTYGAYEGKLFFQYDHRFSNYNGKDFSPNHNYDYNFKSSKRYSIDKNVINNKIEKNNWQKNWQIAFRLVCRATDNRTFISSIIPRSATMVSAPTVVINDFLNACILVGNINSFSFDFVVRTKLGGTALNHFIVKQLPLVPIKAYTTKIRDYINRNVLYLSYTCIDLIDFATDFNFPKDPIQWDHHERFLKQCELDAIYAHLYSLEKEEMEYILDTFPIVKRKDINKYGSYRTKETILKMYDDFSWVKDELNQTLQNN